MTMGNGFRSYEEFEREELKRDQRLEVTYEELLSDFVDDGWKRKKEKREGLFDSFADEEY